MGQDVSNQVDARTPPQTLQDRSLEAVARLILEGKAQRIVVLTGAGISTAAGIPDFRSPGTGLYANLQRLDLPYAEAVFSIDYFRANPRPFYVLAKELFPGRFHPTVSHAFLALLAERGLLRMLFTQNIDCLERAAGVPADRLVEAHGSFASHHCINPACGAPFADDAMRAHVRADRVPRCAAPGCGGALVKPDIVFFGESLPPRFHDLGRRLPATDTDLVLVLGTSLTVYPFAGLPARAPDHVPRVLFNREAVGDLGTRADDVLVLDSCDAGVRRLADALGWRDALEARWRALVGDAEADRQLREGPQLAAAAAAAAPRAPSSSSSSSSSEAEVADKEDAEAAIWDGAPDGGAHDADDADDADDANDANDQPPEIGGALASAEAEVNEMAQEIEAVLKLDDDRGGEAAETTAEATAPAAAAAPEKKTAQAAATDSAAAADATGTKPDTPRPLERPQL